MRAYRTNKQASKLKKDLYEVRQYGKKRFAKEKRIHRQHYRYTSGRREKVIAKLKGFFSWCDENDSSHFNQEHLKEDSEILLQMDYLVISAFNIKLKAERITKTARSCYTHRLYDFEHLDGLKDISVQLKNTIISAVNIRKQITATALLYNDNRARMKLLESSKELIVKTEAILRKIRCAPRLATDQIVLKALDFIQRSITELENFKQAIQEELRRFEWFSGQNSTPGQHNDLLRSAADIIVDALHEELRFEGSILRLKLSHARQCTETMTNMLITTTAAQCGIDDTLADESLSHELEIMNMTKRAVDELKEENSRHEAKEQDRYNYKGCFPDSSNLLPINPMPRYRFRFIFREVKERMGHDLYDQIVQLRRNIDHDIYYEFNAPTNKSHKEANEKEEQEKNSRESFFCCLHINRFLEPTYKRASLDCIYTIGRTDIYDLGGVTQLAKKPQHIVTSDMDGENMIAHRDSSLLLCGLCINQNEAVNWCGTCNLNICFSCTCFHNDVRMMMNHCISILP